MELQSARDIIGSLARGIHPATGEVMADDSPYRLPVIAEALDTIAQAAEGLVPKPRRALPANAGKPWPPGDDARLASAFDAGTDLKQIAQDFLRTPFAVESRLVKLGKLQPRVGRYGVPGSAQG